MSCDCRPSTDLCDSCVELLGSGAEQERLRIIALLEAKLPPNIPQVTGRLMNVRDVIALIKGETE